MKEYQQHEQLEAINGYVNGNLSEEKAFDAVRGMQPSQWRSMYGFEYGISSIVYTLHKKNGKTIDVCTLLVKTYKGDLNKLFEEENRCALREEEISHITDREGNDIHFEFSVEKRIEKYKKDLERIEDALERCEFQKEWIKDYHYGDEEAIQRNLAENEDNIKYYQEIKEQNEKILKTIIT